MKILTIIALVFIATTTRAQEVKNSVDEFTGTEIKKTEWRYIKQGFGISMAVSFRKINGKKLLFAAITVGVNDYFSIHKGAELMLKTDSGKVVRLIALEGQIASRGGAYIDQFAGSEAVGVTMIYELKEDDIDILSLEKVIKFRLYTNTGYYDEDIKDKKAIIILNAIKSIM